MERKRDGPRSRGIAGKIKSEKRAMGVRDSKTSFPFALCYEWGEPKRISSFALQSSLIATFASDADKLVNSSPERVPIHLHHDTSSEASASD